MFWFFVGAAAHKSNPRGVEDAAEGFAIIFLIIAAILGICIFGVMPVFYCIGSVQVGIYGLTETVTMKMAEGAIGVLFAAVVGLSMLSAEISDRVAPYPSDYRVTDWSAYYAAEKKAKKAGWISLAAVFGALGILVGMAFGGYALAMAGFNVLAAIVFTLIGVLSVASLVGGIVMKIFC